MTSSNDAFGWSFACLIPNDAPLWVISVRRYYIKHDLDGKSNNSRSIYIKLMMMMLWIMTLSWDIIVGR